MFDTLPLLPFEFWLASLAIAVAIFTGISNLNKGIGVPLLAVLATVSAWYVGDVLYNDYETNHLLTFPTSVLSFAWLQVTIFVCSLLAGILLINPVANSDCINAVGKMFQLVNNGPFDSDTQRGIITFHKLCWGVFGGLIALAIFNVGSDTISFLLPLSGNVKNPFVRPRVGGGAMAAVLALAQNFQVLAAAGFGLTAALSKNPNVRMLALIGCLLTWPFFLLNRTRNTMLAVCAPAIFAWVFVRIRSHLAIKIVILLALIFAGDTWLRFVMQARNNRRSVASYFWETSTTEIMQTETKHAGLNMYEELCWVNHLMNEGRYKPNWGARYFAEAVNPVPRVLWPGKPLIGIDYAIARGQKFEQAGEGQAGVGATISTGMIGQGVDNFGPFFGPIAAGLLMAGWVCVLARIDLHKGSHLRLPLYAIGLVLTFNMGRDITLLVAYPFVFGLMLVKYLESRQFDA